LGSLHVPESYSPRGKRSELYPNRKRHVMDSVNSSSSIILTVVALEEIGMAKYHIQCPQEN